ncbi:MAG: penicillin-binding transpeptidase domain-containing protein [Mycobacterium sp.]
MTRRCVLSIVFGVLLVVSTSCSLFSSSGPDDAFHAFADALQRRDAGAAAASTDDPAAATAAITSMFDGMGPAAQVKVDVSSPGDPTPTDENTAKLSYTWSFGPGKTLQYEATATAAQSGDDWRVRWSPTDLQPKLRAGMTFQYSDDKNFLTPVTDRDGQPILTWQTVGVVNLTRDHLDSAAVLAPLLQPFDPSITAESITGQFAATQDDLVTVVKLRQDDLATVADQLKQIAGVTVAEQGALLTTNRDLASPAIDGLQALWQKAIDDAAGWSVHLVDDKGEPTEELASTPPRDTAPIRTTLDTRLQLLAQQAVAAEPRPAVVVAISPSTGGLLAAAQNAAANGQGPIAFTGSYPPGSTFKTITTAAALQAGLATPQTPEPCPGTITVENRTIPNDDEFELGTVPLSTAFARSCNTTMASLADALPADALPNMARLFGIGVDYVIPGLTTITGSVPNADTAAQKVENGIGQGTVTVSPFGLAVAEASLGHGATITPTLVVGEPTTSDTPSAPIPPAIVDSLRTMMRQTVSEGTATALQDVPGLGGKTGTAEFGDNTHSHGWFAGIVDDIAFATLVVGGDTSAPAITVSGDFLRPALAG